MKFFCSKNSALLFLTFIFLNSYICKGQVDSLSTSEIEEILILESNIQGLLFQLSVEVKQYELFEIENEGFFKNNNFWLSDTIQTYNDALVLKSILEERYNLKFHVKYIIFDKEVDREAVDSYLNNLIRNEIFIPMTNGASEVSDGELIILGSKVDFKPFHKLKLKLLQDIKVIILISILVLFLLSSIILVVIMIFIKSRNKQRNELSKKFKELTYEPISIILFDKSLEEIESYSKAEIESYLPKNYLSKPLFKMVLIQEIISLNKNMKGEFKLKLKLFYRKLDLHLFSINRLKSKSWDVVTSAIVEINEMDLKEALPEIEKLVNHKNFHIRSSAVATQLNLSLDKNLNVLANQTYPLSAWQQMIYLRIIKYLSSKDVVKIIYLMESENPSVRIFGIKLVRYLGRMDRIAKLAEMYPAASEEEKIEILKGFNSLGAQTELDHVHQSLFSNKERLCLQAIKTLKNIGDEKSELLLQERLKSVDSFVLQKEILSALVKLNKDSFDQFVMDESNETFIAIQNHLQDPLLSDV